MRYEIAAQAVKDAYNGKGHNIGSTEWCSYAVKYKGEDLQVLGIAGTNELVDWFWNLLGARRRSTSIAG